MTKGDNMSMVSLRKARTNAGLTIVEASKRLGIAPNTLSNYERGESFPDVPMIKKIEDLYGVEYKHIFFEV